MLFDTDSPPSPPPVVMIEQVPARRRMPTVSNFVVPAQTRPPESAPDRADGSADRQLAPQEFVAPGGMVVVDLPARMPATCISEAARDYRLNPMILLAILKVESNGRPGAIGKNTNGSVDIGPSQLNSNSWAPFFVNRFNIPVESLLNDMCQAVRAMAYAVRTEINAAGGNVWLGIGNYHVGTPRTAARERAVAAERQKYIGMIHGAHARMVALGKF